METTTLLCDSLLCRLCGEENKSGSSLFESEENKGDLIQLVNKYLPIKVENDGKFPSTICPGCNIQLQATKIFFDLIIEGQTKLRNLFNLQVETKRRQEKQKQQLESALKNVNPNTSVESYEILQSDETGEQFLIKIISDGPLFPQDHELSLKIEGLDKPKRKRGRPPKPAAASEEKKDVEKAPESKEDQQATNEEEAELDNDGRRRRRIKAPSRYSEVLQGKELDRVFKEEGVIDEDSLSEDEMFAVEEKQMQDEIIGHMEDKNGEDTGQLIVINRTPNKFRLKSKSNNQSNGANKNKKKYDCEICGKVFLHQGRLDVHRALHKNFKYKCSEINCDFEAENKNLLEEHHKEFEHSGITLFENLENYGQIKMNDVKLDDKSIDQSSENQENQEDTVSDKNDNENNQTDEAVQKKEKFKLECPICKKQFSCKQNYEIHCKAVHENERPYQCDMCDKTFPYINSLKNHLTQHAEKIYQCDTCDKQFNHPSSLVYHREAEHNNGRRFICNKCTKSFKHKQLLLRHQLVHSDDRPHACKYCDACFKTRANLLNHMPTHTGEKKHYCPTCGQSFAHKTSLTLHMRWHNGQKPYTCDICHKSFSQKGNLAEHRRIHTGEKPYCCDVCGRKFTTSSQFKLHIKRHTGERPWRCEYCSKTFLHKDTWKCHTRRHRNEKPYQCSQCLRGFTEQWALRKHERLHTGEKPYQCDICSKCFADSSNLAKHKKIHLNSVILKDTKASSNTATNEEIKIVTNQNGESQILYLALHDAHTSSTPQTLVHIVDNVPSTPEEAANSNSLDNTLFTQLPIQDESEMSLAELQIQQLIDQDGNPLSIPTSSGDIKLVSANTGESSNFHGLLPDGTLIPFNLNVSAQDGKSTLHIDSFFNNVTKDDEKNKTDKEDIPGSIEQLLDNQPNLQFLEEGQNVCFVTAYTDDPLNQQYLN